MNNAMPSRKNSRLTVRVVGWTLAIVAWAAWLAFAGGASRAFLILGVISGLVVEAIYWIATFRRAFRPWKPAVPTVRFAKGP